MKNINLISLLNNQQKQAIFLNNENSLILAGAGSGKTKVLTSRIAYLCIEKNISPFNILGVTFTNKAAKEIQNRVELMLNTPIAGMWLGTFHSISYRILKKSYSYLGLDKNFIILDSNEQLQIIKKIIKELNIDDFKYQPRVLQSYINSQKDNGLRSSNIESKNENDIYINIYKEYEQKLKKENALDFADLLLYTYELFQKNPQIRKYYQNIFKYILIDEFQDTNEIQYKLIKAISSKETCIMVVGDDDQSIYGWRGAKVENIQHFINDFDDVKIIKLEQNYRSTNNILKVANSIIKNNKNRLGKNLWSNNIDGEKVNVYKAFSDKHETEYIIKKIKKLHSDGIKYKDISILYRSNFLSRIFEENLIKNNIPYKIYGGLRFSDREEIKDILAYLRLALFQKDNFAFERIINKPARGIGTKTLDIIKSNALVNSISYWESLADIIAKGLVTKRAINSLIKFVDIIYSISEKIEKFNLYEIINFTIDKTEIAKIYQNKITEIEKAKLENIKELANLGKTFELENTNALNNKLDILENFLSLSMLESSGISSNDKGDYIQLMTIHSSKGLEFPYVFIVGMEDGIFPHTVYANENIDFLSEDSIKELQEKLFEERRLFYVAITRAMKSLTITYSDVRYIYGKSNFNSKSRFLNEIEDNLINYELDNNKNYQQNNFKKNSFGISSFDFLKENNKFDFKVNDEVVHKIFGDGIIKKIEKSGNNIYYKIDFINYGEKLLLSNICNIVKKN